MTSKTSKYAAAALIAATTAAVILFGNLSQPAWALDDAIEALRAFRAVHITGIFPGGSAEVWMRANDAATRSTDVVARGSHGAITWAKDGSTFHYEPDQRTVYFEKVLTLGLAQWLGSDLLDMLGEAANATVIHGRDAATGRDRATLICSITDVNGPQSWEIEFDVASRLPVSFKNWSNLDRHGPPSFEAVKITYHKDLPDSVFEVQIPPDVTYIEKELSIPETSVGLLTNPEHGISTEGMDRQAAAEKAVRILTQAVIDQDLDGLKNICPLCHNWGDEFLRKAIIRPDRDDRILEVLEVGKISRTGRSALGPIVAVPTVFRLADGTRVRQIMVVQFRKLGTESSCVVHGPHGLPYEIE